MFVACINASSSAHKTVSTNLKNRNLLRAACRTYYNIGPSLGTLCKLLDIFLHFWTFFGIVIVWHIPDWVNQSGGHGWSPIGKKAPVGETDCQIGYGLYPLTRTSLRKTLMCMFWWFQQSFQQSPPNEVWKSNNASSSIQNILQNCNCRRWGGPPRTAGQVSGMCCRW